MHRDLIKPQHKLMTWFSGKSWRNDMISRWGVELTRIESSPDSAEGQIRIQRTRYGGGIRSSPSFEYAVEIYDNRGGAQLVKAKLECVVATRKSELANQGSLVRIGKWYDGSTKSELIWLFKKYKTDQLEDAECRRFTAPIVAQLKVDNTRNPHLLFIETDESRLWCLAGEETKKLH